MGIKELIKTLGRNAYPPYLINNTVKRYLHQKYSENENKVDDKNAKSPDKRYFKLPYIGKYSVITKHKIGDIVKRYCKNIGVTLIFTTTKIKDSFSYKDKLDFSHKAFVVYKFICAGCNSSYIGETERHLSTRIREHMITDKKSHIYKHLQSSLRCHELSDSSCFSILDTASTSFQLKIKEGLHIKWDKPSLNKQVKHYFMSLTV